MIIDTAPWLCQILGGGGGGRGGGPEKRMKGIFVYALDFKLTLDKMQSKIPVRGGGNKYL